MNLIKLSQRHLLAKPLGTFLSILLLTLGAGIISFLILLHLSLEDRLNRNISGIDMVVGAKGSPLQLILWSIYHLDSPTGNIPLHEAEKFVSNPSVEKAIPLAYGDNFQGYPIVGTTIQYVEHYNGEVAAGHLWQQPFDACVGAAVAERLQLQIGDTFSGTHGLAAEGGHVHNERAYRIVGILAPANSVLDQLVLTAMESIWLLHEHDSHSVEEPIEVASATDHANEDERHHPAEEVHAPGARQEITAMLVKFRNPMAALQLPKKINTESNIQAALPAIEVNRLFTLLGFSVEVLQAIGLLIMAVAGISVFVSLYNSLKDRQYELAIMRTLGASRFDLFAMVMLEALHLSIAGFVAGLLLSRLGIFILYNILADMVHGNLYRLGLQADEIYLLLICLLIGFMAALLPACQALSTNISKTLSHAS
ncbi:ABC transporter permease [Pontibacter sp. SGAir0037]|uniref:ABC transporter permease n=1 Tax=Pontibacter sp. SGAir0037 TaxID=2571030 RepID=UPI0010CD2B6C|nr:FtsX-like permease family protein [Pontibacter sp. SGAir0037]QCR21613.1 hypothetical protein C1N53_04135 [Pontibacter sp. SGAir0037]